MLRESALIGAVGVNQAREPNRDLHCAADCHVLTVG